MARSERSLDQLTLEFSWVLNRVTTLPTPLPSKISPRLTTPLCILCIGLPTLKQIRPTGLGMERPAYWFGIIKDVRNSAD